MKPLLEYCPKILERAEEMLKNAAVTGDKKQVEFFADSVGDDSIEINRLLLNMIKATRTKNEGDLVAVLLEIEDRLLANACEGFDTGALA